MRSKKKPALADWLANNGLTLVAFLGGMAFNAFTLASNLATKPYVDDGLTIQRKYTDEKAAQILKGATDYADMKQATLMLELSKLGAEQKAQGVKLDMVLETVRDNTNRIKASK